MNDLAGAAVGLYIGAGIVVGTIAVTPGVLAGRASEKPLRPWDAVMVGIMVGVLWWLFLGLWLTNPRGPEHPRD